MPLVYLASLPRSGNTWVRYLLEASTGIFTCVGGPEYHQYRNVSNRNASRTPEQIWQVSRKGFNQWVDFGYLGELLNWTQGNTLVARSQTWPQPWSVKEADRIDDTLQHPLAAFPPGLPRRAVVIIRDPFREFISWKKYDRTHSMVNEGDMTELYHGPEWHHFVTYYAREWYDLYSRWIEYTDDVYILHYHRLMSDTMVELGRILRFLEVEPDPARLECVRGHLEGRVHSHRHGVVPDNVTYPTRLRAEVWRHVHQLNQDFKARGWQPLPLDSYSFADQFADIGV
ncbi:WSC domain-containing protein 2 [Amphibalanus amphitrite]|uniref:WSC domain-containing protein 2 n=1 Tax=Amphibalanus amphitrite TaxID=1232801 RepID=A0A6A4WLC4_AMPAM|nr:WSC domain-containing protein 2 [Amphibalanus amphitrite]